MSSCRMSSSTRPWSSSTAGSGPGLATRLSRSFTSCARAKRRRAAPWLVLGGRTSVSGHRRRGPLQLRDDPQGGRSPPRAQPSRDRCLPGRRPSGRGTLGNRARGAGTSGRAPARPQHRQRAPRQGPLRPDRRTLPPARRELAFTDRRQLDDGPALRRSPAGSHRSRRSRYPRHLVGTVPNARIPEYLSKATSWSYPRTTRPWASPTSKRCGSGCP